MIELLHQLGFRYQWSLASLTDEGSGNGAIIGPRYMERAKVISLPRTIRERSIFDPQFYLPNSNQGKLTTYPFFPHVVAGGFSTTEWNEELALQSASQCLSFQNECGFKYVVIPTRFRSGMPSDYIESQSRLFVEPFLKSYRNQAIDKPCLLQLILTDQMLKDENYRRDILNWVTGMREVEGIYLIYHLPSRHKQIDDIDFLLAAMSFVNAIKRANMTVVMGYLNTEAIPLLVVEPDAITIGSYENLRMFDVLPYQDEEEMQQHRGPNARIYVSRLLQWIEHQYIGAIARVIDNRESFFDDSQHRVIMFEPTYNWHFTKPEPYKHYFVTFAQQFRRLISYNGHDRFDAVREECQRALSEFQSLENRGIILDSESSGRHLPAWLTALNLFEQTL